MKRATCRRGHPWSENARINKKGFRFCAACKKAADQAYMRRAKTKPPGKDFCPRGHAMIEGNLVWGSGWVCLTCKRDHERRFQRTVTHEQVSRVVAALHEGKLLSECHGLKDGRYVGGKLVDSRAFTRFLNANPRVKTKIRKLAMANRLAAAQAMTNKRILIAAPALLKNEGADAYEAIMRATAHLWEGERGDVMSLMFLAVAEGKLDPRQAESRLPEFVREHRRQFSKFGPVSLDAPAYGEGATTIGDLVTTGLWQ